MIHRFWEELFKIRDEYKAQGNWTAYNAVGKVKEALQNAYDDGLQFKSRIRGKKPVGKTEELVLSIPDIRVYKDNMDSTYFYELDNRHFDEPEEVIEWLIKVRSGLEADVMSQCKSDILAYIQKLVEDVAPARVIQKRTPYKVIEGGEDE